MARAEELAARLRVGSVMVNDVIVGTAHPALPFGGVRRSGWGVTRGEEGLLAMTVPQVLCVRTGKFRPHFDASRSGGVAEMMAGLLLRDHAESGTAGPGSEMVRGMANGVPPTIRTRSVSDGTAARPSLTLGF